MKKHFIIGFMMLFSLSSFGQEKQDNMDKLVTQCEKVVEYTQQIKELKDSIRSTNQRIQALRDAWTKTCKEYLASEEQTLDDFQYLISNTDSIHEKDLYLKLVEASKKMPKNDKPKPRPADDTKPVITQKPDPVKSNDGSKEPEKTGDEKGRKEEGQKTPPTTPAKKDKGDMDDDLKSVIGNKGKK